MPPNNRLAPRLLLLALAGLATTVHAQTPVLEISGANFRPLPLAIPAPQPLADDAKAAAAVFDEAFLFDATSAGIFQVLDRKSFLADARDDLAGNLALVGQRSIRACSRRSATRAWSIPVAAAGTRGAPAGR